MRLPDGCHYQESSLRRQNVIASWAFAALIGMQILGFLPDTRGLETFIATSSALILFAFATLAYGSDGGFWSKRRNKGVGLIVILAGSFVAEMLIAMPNFIPVLSALAISHLCRKRYLQIVVSSVKDLEAIHAKLLKQEANFQNTRNFDTFPIQKSS
ncbi:MAG: hypothetical protein H7249_15475 [Chitinophagaceae bacterium]|nr:hypothetical protein [Oligoflexus sp.]